MNAVKSIDLPRGDKNIVSSLQVIAVILVNAILLVTKEISIRVNWQNPITISKAGTDNSKRELITFMSYKK